MDLRMQQKQLIKIVISNVECTAWKYNVDKWCCECKQREKMLIITNTTIMKVTKLSSLIKHRK